MTRQEFDKGVTYLAAFFPNFNPAPRNLDAWYAATQHIPSMTFQIALSLICQNEARWWPDTNMAGMVARYHDEAKQVAAKRLSVVPPSKRLSEPMCTPEEARANVAKIMELIEGVGINTIQ